MEDIQTITKPNPLLERLKIPGETVRLPSGGIFYKSEELQPSVKNGEVHVYPLTTFDEIVLKSPDKLINGSAIDEVFRRCIPEVQKPLELFAKDVDYLTMALKRVTFGPFLELQYNHGCSPTSKEYTYTCDVNEFMKNAKAIDPTTIGENYKLTLPNGQVVEILPTRFRSVIAMLEDANAQKQGDDLIILKDRVMNSITNVIESVDAIADKALIREWLEQVGAGWMRQITEGIEKAGNWGPDTTFKTTCKDCNEPIALEVPLNPVTFFT